MGLGRSLATPRLHEGWARGGGFPRSSPTHSAETAELGRKLEAEENKALARPLLGGGICEP